MIEGGKSPSLTPKLPASELIVKNQIAHFSSPQELLEFDLDLSRFDTDEHVYINEDIFMRQVVTHQNNIREVTRKN